MSLQRCLKVVNGDTSRNTVNKALKLAFATTDMKHVDQHFGSAQAFAIYAVELKYARLLEVAQFDKVKQDSHEDKLVSRIAMLEGCIAVYCQAVGSSAVRQLQAQGIQPIKVAVGTDIADLTESVQEMLGAGVPAWLAKAVARQQGQSLGRFDAMEAEGWEE
ncbi:MAG TPA: nitrogen fixation protein NifX [Acidiferrobacteraceae bacterium]|nr:nitrogen fixation protein NifX [Acidiferrobacteraceae bacterium]HEX19258.1 nitrogen fixation protein NifX [Acidiferrobacteraceae bacterium]